jgi:hypothetical protein
MSTDGNLMMKRVLQKVANNLISTKKYNQIVKVDIFFVFGSSHKTAMCQYVYGMKIKTQLPFTKRVDLLREFQLDLKNNVEKSFNTVICATDVVVEN